VINIETEILNKDYDSCLHKQQQQQTQQQQQQQQQQQESSHPSIDIYSYTVDDEEDHSTADNDEYAVPDDLFEVKRKGSNPPPSVPPPYAWKGIAMVEESVNGVGNSSSVDNFDCLYATIGSKEEEKEQAISALPAYVVTIPTISCYAACNNFNVPPALAPASAGFFLNKNDEYTSNMSTVHYCDYCESQCSADCEQIPKYGSTVLWCMRSVPANSSKEESMNNGDGDGFIFDNSVSVEWIEPSPTLASPSYLSSPVNHQLCLCSSSTGATQCNSSSDEGVYKCIIKGSDVTETLQFTYSVYKLTTVPSTSAPGNNVIITSSSSVKNDQNSTLPYYGGIGLLATTNLLTFIVLVTSCVALGRSRANVTVQSNPIGSLSVINIETEILNKDYDSCLHKQQQQQTQQQQQQQESSHPSIDIYSYVVVDEDCTHSTADDNDEYAVPDDLFEMKKKGSNPPPPVPPPYAGKGLLRWKRHALGRSRANVTVQSNPIRSS
uniref:Uncharacterized protein n=1 Tax=Amphimedon queenslandica TaxID=400682 RepID=A0A1X7U7C2_AMPQE